MQLISGGPDLPLELLHAQEEGKLVFFCGAGISYSSGLPSFKQLVEEVRDRLNASFTPQEQIEFSQSSFDRVLGLLEDRFGAPLRREVIARLTPAQEPVLNVHKAILRLGRRPNQCLQVVTTNFDNLFLAADPTCLTIDAPLVPVPKPDKWDGLVHLHGRIDRNDASGHRMVLTSADFGAAYLVERWAARFVSELFQQFHVVFVGYSVSDPVMRYVVDAIAVERRVDPRLHLAYAFSACPTDEIETKKNEWKARGIEPILYDPKNHHALLADTLVVWAEKFNARILSKVAVVNELAEREPAALDPEQLQHFCWAIRDSSGAPARRLGELKAKAKFGWVKVLEDSGLLKRSPNLARHVGLVGGDNAIAELDEVGFQLAHWIAEHAGSPDCLQWARERGSVLHPVFKAAIFRQLDSGGFPTQIADSWRLMGRQRGGSFLDHEGFALRGRLLSEEWRPSLKLAVLDALQPCLNFQDRPFPPLFGDADESGRIRRLVDVDCDVRVGKAAEDVVGALTARADWPSIAEELLPDINSLLHNALDQLAATDRASATEDLSYIQHPSIPPDAQNRHFEGWTWLIELLRRCVDASPADSPNFLAVVNTWRAGSYPLIRRFALYSARTKGSPPKPAVAALMTRAPSVWLWNLHLQVELFPLLRTLRNGLSPDARRELLKVIAAGPPATFFPNGLKRKKTKDLANRLVWERLSRFCDRMRASARPGVLRALEKQYPAFRLSDDDSGAFLYRVTVGSGPRRDLPAEDLASLPIDQVIALIENRKTDEGTIHDLTQLVTKDLARGVEILEALASKKNFSHELWRAVLFGVRQAKTTDDDRGRVFDLIDLIPKSVITRMQWELAELLLGWLSAPTLVEHRAVGKIAQLAKLDPLTPLSGDGDLLTAALNRPIGKLASATLEVLRLRKMKRNSRLPADVKRLLAFFIGRQASDAILARVVIASRLPLLRFVDPQWTDRHLLPLFDWEHHSEAKAAWQGFLWSPWVDPALWDKLRPHAIETFKHLGSLGRQKKVFIPFILSISVDARHLSHAQTRQFLRALEPPDLALAAHELHALFGQATDLDSWKRVADWFASVWPKEIGAQSADVSEYLANLTTLFPERFAAAVMMVIDHVGHVKSAHSLFDRLNGGIATAQPTESLRLIGKITPTTPNAWFGELGRFLSIIGDAEPDLKASHEFRRLQEIATTRAL